ncbi:CpaF family protein [Neobacillus rhizophilus]|uniref:CpaF family protein n=1 Tax=Neobacillus rhizophilus TaxID=2833579 RepID=A0A942YUV4_9BACI|nr:CpaF family protein [Neobacillus rhizophilus]MBS4213282.1 CpaF family protein [Neobacillus rhizophilus]MBU8914605.1 CpaF family protein [Bacillus sp. FJAT-29953]
MSLFKRYLEEVQGSAPKKDAPVLTEARKSQEFWEIETSLHNYLLEELKKYPGQDKEKEKRKIVELADAFFEQEGTRLTFEEKQEIIDYVTNELLAYGPITSLLQNPLISEVMVNHFDEVYYEQEGKISKSHIHFVDNQHVMRVIERIVSPIGRRIDESSPMVDARLPDGSRVNAIIPPLALKGPSLTIRKFSETPFTIKDLIGFGTLDQTMAEFLEICVKSRLNVFISGGTGSGKTSTLNVLSSFIPNKERIVTIEDAAELKLNQEHIVGLESRPPNIEGKGEITIRDLVRNALRMRPDRIVVGEVRGAEALDMLQAMNTGHDGGLSTGHANSPRDILSRIETMVLMAGYELPVKAIREQIANAIDLIVHQARMKDGTRKITHITEVLNLEGDTIVLQDLFVFKEQGYTEDGKIIGNFVSTGIRPRFTEQLEMNGYSLPATWFYGGW